MTDSMTTRDDQRDQVCSTIDAATIALDNTNNDPTRYAEASIKASLAVAEGLLLISDRLQELIDEVYSLRTGNRTE